MNNMLREYLEGIENFPKDKKLTPSSLCKFLGKDPSSLKRSRITEYPYLAIVFEKIDNFSQYSIHQKRIENSIDREKRLKKKYKDEKDEYKNLLTKAYAREVMLINRIDILEKENLRLNEIVDKNKLNRFIINSVV
ncbi:hypothetical protein [Halarcobacter sp.]|uniref:hypothetical protein n=1 Tax=Arcobacteraceae TaxID=2808963 RepID=UPI003A900F87